MLKGNKGEWAEAYAFLKLLADGGVYAADADLTPNRSQRFEVNSIAREGFRFKRKNNAIIIAKNNDVHGTYPIDELRKNLKLILHDIENSEGRTFTSVAGDTVMGALKQSKLKAPASQKTDLLVGLFDPRSLSTRELGFSVKSYLGSNPTLLNASHATKFVFRIDPKTEEVRKQLTAFAEEASKRSLDSQKLRDEIRVYISDQHSIGRIGFSMSRMLNQQCRKNFMMIDSSFPFIFGNIIAIHYLNNESNLADIAKKLEDKDPLFVDTENFYTKKIEDFLVAVALGLEPAKSWNGIEETSGGYLVVKNGGDLVCYSAYDRMAFREYLLKHTKLDTPSARKFLNQGESLEDGLLFREGDAFFITLNRQIRFY